MSISAHIFRNYNIRGLVHEVTPEVAQYAARALLALTQAKKVVLGQDMRQTSPELARAACEVFLSAGVEVIDIGMCTSSLYNFAVTSQGDACAGYMVTASHNPAAYNGIKMAYPGGLPIAGTTVFAHGNDAPPLGEVRGTLVPWSDAARSAYLEKCITQAGPLALQGIKIVVDYGNGMGALTFRPLCEKVGVDVVELYPEPDATFPHHEANPAKEETLYDLQKKVRDVGADFGVALDGDADRIAFVDNEGVSVQGDTTLALLAKYFLAKTPGGKVLYSLNSSWKTEEIIRQYGGIPIACPVGNTNIIALLRSQGGIVGGEVSSHFFFPEFHDLESVDFTFLLVASMWKKSQQTFAEFIKPFRPYFTSKEMNYEVEDQERALVLLKEVYEKHATICSTLDGFRYEFDRDWWILLRKSNTEPLLRITIEAKSLKVLEEKKQEVARILAQKNV